MTITVRELVSDPHLGVTVLAGSNNLDRIVNWAHSCDLADPTHWLTEGVLVMTNGITIPIKEKDQISYLQKIINAQASGLAVSEGLHAPELTKGLIRFADQHDFPIISVAYDVPWIAFSKNVATANVIKEQKKVMQTLHLYDLISKSIINSTPVNIIKMINELANVRIHIVDLENELVLFNGNTNHDFLKNMKDKPINDVPLSINSVKWMEKKTYYIPLSTSRSLVMFIRPLENTSTDKVVLKHIATLIGLIIERDTTILERQRRIGSDIFTKMIQGNVTGNIGTLLHDHNFEDKSVAIVAVNKSESDYVSLHLLLHDLKIPHLITNKENNLLLLLPENSITSVLDRLSGNLHIGISNPVSSRLIRIPDAHEEALWAMHSAQIQNKKVVYYSEKSPASIFITNNRENAKEIVESTLGSLIAYDKTNNSQLVKTLYVYLSEMRSWKRTAEKLHIHKQTLVYRIKRIEEVTGRKLNDINDISEFWIALKLASIVDKDYNLS